MACRSCRRSQPSPAARACRWAGPRAGSALRQFRIGRDGPGAGGALRPGDLWFLLRRGDYDLGDGGSRRCRSLSDRLRDFLRVDAEYRVEADRYRQCRDRRFIAERIPPRLDFVVVDPRHDRPTASLER